MSTRALREFLRSETIKREQERWRSSHIFVELMLGPGRLDKLDRALAYNRPPRLTPDEMVQQRIEECFDYMQEKMNGTD